VIVVKGKEVEYDLARRLLGTGLGVMGAIEQANRFADALKKAGIVQEGDDPTKQEE
jgi:hypothetical protein